uniref:Cat eye syndrome critical region protein 5 n=2 Tax=Schistocephalus solidus TaxID=70667 RepID=A0A0X3NUP3_SCHSO
MIKISPQDIVMSHTPLRQYSELFDRHVAVCGLGPVKEIAHNLGFKKVSTIEEISAAFPFLDACKPKEEMHTGPISHPNLEKIEAIILFGEPQRWEHSLQILLDLLIHDGDPSKNLEDCGSDYQSHLPVFACSSDLVWAGEAPSPRLAHGSFLICLESLYERITGHRLQYTSLIGKPSPVTYTFALSQLNAIAAKDFGATQPLRRIYCIGDNVDVDVYGANLYNLCLKTLTSEAFTKISRRVHSLIQEEHPNLTSMPFSEPGPEEAGQRSIYDTLIESSLAMPNILQQLAAHTHLEESVCSFSSILVLTGVYQEHHKLRVKWPDLLKPVKDIHPDLPHLPSLRVPDFVARDIEEAIKYILFLEGCLNEQIQVTRSCPYLDESHKD